MTKIIGFYDDSAQSSNSNFAGILAATSLITMLVATLVAWNAVRVRPLDVLRYE